MNIIEALDKEQLRSDIPEFRAGDTVKVYVKVVEGTRFLRRWRRKNFPGTQPASGEDRSSAQGCCSQSQTVLSA